MYGIEGGINVVWVPWGIENSSEILSVKPILLLSYRQASQ